MQFYQKEDEKYRIICTHTYLVYSKDPLMALETKLHRGRCNFKTVCVVPFFKTIII